MRSYGERIRRIRALRHALRGLDNLRGPAEPDRSTIVGMLHEEHAALVRDFPFDPDRGREDGA